MVVIFRIRHVSRGDSSAKSDLASPQVIRDHVDDLWNPIDGSRITSKRAYAKQLATNGLAIDENPKMRDKNGPSYDASGLRQDIVQALREPSRPGEPLHIADLD